MKNYRGLRKILITVSLVSTVSVYANPAHEKLLSIADSKRKLVFAAFLTQSGESCSSVTKTFYQGSDKTGNAFWNATCLKADSYVIQVNNDAQGSTKILNCKILKVINAGTCFTKFKN